MTTNRTHSPFFDKVAIVTGGASGIGKALVHELCREGATVVIADRQVEESHELAASLRNHGFNVDNFHLDVTNYDIMESLVTHVHTTYGKIDYFFNNAGIMFMGDLENYSIDDWNYAVDVNLRGVINGVQAVFSVMKSQGFGHIINTASMAGLIPTAGSISYTTTKHAVVGLTRALKTEAASHGIDVSLFCPGVIRTPIMDGGKFGRDIQNLSPTQKKSFLDAIEKIRPMDPDLFAKKALQSVAKREFTIILPRWNKIMWHLDRTSSRLGLKMAEMGYQNIKKSIEH